MKEKTDILYGFVQNWKLLERSEVKSQPDFDIFNNDYKSSFGPSWDSTMQRSCSYSKVLLFPAACRTQFPISPIDSRRLNVTAEQTKWVKSPWLWVFRQLTSEVGAFDECHWIETKLWRHVICSGSVINCPGNCSFTASEIFEYLK